ncbi:hypothetical protein J2W35_001008 [Variovorax boronicumulans]|uniref:hypothetical protein n=1 Tax=Variovorax boronicumulans TaxID=436515 RepID=UPI00278B65CD|nr:hypothetical protein [Variovorax boronicumulans]MDQ0080678.1 hypothetical protein [Variovorax boronicumulans]
MRRWLCTSAVIAFLCCHGLAVLAQNMASFGQYQANVAQVHQSSACELHQGHAGASVLDNGIDSDEVDLAAGRREISLPVLRPEAPLEFALTVLPSAPLERPMRPPQLLSFFA